MQDRRLTNCIDDEPKRRQSNKPRQETRSEREEREHRAEKEVESREPEPRPERLLRFFSGPELAICNNNQIQNYNQHYIASTAQLSKTPINYANLMAAVVAASAVPSRFATPYKKKQRHTTLADYCPKPGDS